MEQNFGKRISKRRFQKENFKKIGNAEYNRTRHDSCFRDGMWVCPEQPSDPQETESGNDLTACSILLKGEIRYGNTSLYDAFTGAAGKLEGKYRDFFLLTAREMQRQKGESFGEIFRKCAEECLVAEELTGEEREKLYSLGRCLGYLGLEMQMKQLELMEEDIRLSFQELQKRLPERKKMYQNLGILLGILLAVIVW